MKDNDSGGTGSGTKVPFAITIVDKAGNQVVTDNTTDNSSVTFDKTTPVLSTVSFRTNNCNPHAAKVDDNATLSVTASEPLLDSSIVVSIHNDNKTAVLSGTTGALNSHQQLSASHIFQSSDNTDSDNQTQIGFSIQYSDPAGNQASLDNSTTDNSSVTFDRKAPTLTVISIDSENASGYDNFSGPGVDINVSFTASEKLREYNKENCNSTCCRSLYVLRTYCDNSSVSCTDNGSTNTSSDLLSWTNTYQHNTSNKTQPAGDNYSFQIHYTDWAGNSGIIQTSTTDNSTLFYDDVKPELTGVSIASDNWNTGQSVAKSGDNVTLTYTVPSEALRVQPPVTKLVQPSSGGFHTPIPTTSDNNTFQAVHRLSNNDSEGKIAFRIVTTDLAGNQVTKKTTTNSSYVVFDRSPPVMKLGLTGTDKSLFTDNFSLLFQDLTGLLKTSASGYAGYDNFSHSNYNAVADCSNEIYLTDNRSNYSNCYALSSVSFKDNRTVSISNVPSNKSSAGIVNNDAYRQSFLITPSYLADSGCPVRDDGSCKVTLHPGALFKVKLVSSVSDIAGNILSPMEVGGDTTSGFKTLEAPFVSDSSPDNTTTGVSRYATPSFVLDLPGTEFSSNMNAINSAYSSGGVTLNHECMTPSGASGTTGTIQVSPVPPGGYHLSYHGGSKPDNVTLRPVSAFQHGREYTVNVTSQVCRPKEKIGLPNNYSYGFSTIDNISASLVAHYPFDGNLLDHSQIGGGYQDGAGVGSLDNASGRYGKTAGALGLDGSSASISIDNHNVLNFTDNFTLSLWVHPVSFSNTLNTLLSKSSTNLGYKLFLNDNGTLRAWWYDSSERTLDSSCSISTNRWSHLVFSHRSGAQKIYVDAQSCASSALNGLLQTGSDALLLGKDHVTPNFYNGRMDELRIYKQALTQAEVLDLFIDTSRGLEGYYPMGNRGGEDYSGKGNHGSVSGAVSSAGYMGISNNAYLFDGSDDVVTVPYNASLNGARFSVIGWIKPTEADQMAGLVSSESAGKGYGIYKWRYRDNSTSSILHKFEFWARPTTNTTNTSLNYQTRTSSDTTAIRDTKQILSGSSDLDIESSSDKWFFISHAYDGSTKETLLRKYTDSTNSLSWVQRTKVDSNLVPNDSGDLWFGKGLGDGTGFFYKGQLDNMRIYSRALIREEVEAIYNIIDTEPPVPGGNGSVSVSSSSGNISLGWSKAMDDRSDNSTLQYAVFSHAETNRIGTVETALRNGTQQLDWTSDQDNASISGLNNSTLYFFSVIVRDEGLNSKAYRIVSITP